MCSGFTFITPFFQRHGIGFLDVILKTINDSPGKFSKEGISKNQYKAMEEIQNNPSLNNLEKVIYLLPKDYKKCEAVTSRWKEFKSEEKLTLVKSSIEEISQNAQETLEDLDKLIKYFDNNENKKFPDYQWLENNWRNLQDVWHIINEFSLATQVKWYEKNSLVFNKEKYEFVSLDVGYADLENEYKTTAALKSWLSKSEITKNTYINLWGTATAFQLAFHYLSWSSPILKPTYFIKCRTSKTAKDKERFTPVVIKLADKDLITHLEDDSPSEELSKDQRITYRWLEQYKNFNDNFTIIILGPKGTGKTKVVTDVYGDENIISINCAQFQSNPELARSELFGHVKGAFTGAAETKNGAFSRANGDGRVLFLDEVHHLDKATQSMLLTALQTKEDGNFYFTPLGAKDPKHSNFQLIVASNAKEDELDNLILPDLFDRISQRVLKIDALKPGESISKEFNNIWKKMKFMGSHKIHNPILETSDIYFQPDFKAWLTDTKRDFKGNYRDLEKISILCADYQRCLDDTFLIQKDTSLVDYVSDNWRVPSKKKEISLENFLNENNQLSLKDITNEFKAKLARSAEYLCGDQKEAAKMLGITAKTLIDIKKRDAL